MRILAQMAQRIVNEVTKVIDEEVIVINRDGYIIAGSDSSRIGNFHEGGKEVITTERKLFITAEEVKRLQGVKIGLNLPIRFQQRVIGVIGITGSKPATIRHGELIQRMTELIIEEAYAAERLDSKMRGIETFVYEWLHSESVTLDFQERGEILGIDMNEPRYCVLAQLDQSEKELIEPGVELDILDTIRAVFPNQRKDVIVRWGPGRFALLLSAKQHSEQKLYQDLHRLSKKVEEKHGIAFGAGISRMHEEASLLHAAYKEAKQALAERGAEEKLVFYDELTLEIALAEVSPETRVKIVEKVLGGISSERELIETLQAYFSNQLSIKETAASLHIHINTLHYRLKKIQELSGYQLKETKELVTLYVALWYYKEYSN